MRRKRFLLRRNVHAIQKITIWISIPTSLSLPNLSMDGAHHHKAVLSSALLVSVSWGFSPMFWCIPHVHNSPPPANPGCIPVSHLLQLFASILDCLYHLLINLLAERSTCRGCWLLVLRRRRPSHREVRARQERHHHVLQKLHSREKKTSRI